MNPQQANSTRLLGVFTLSMISVSAIIALRNLPTFAKNGFSIIYILSLAAMLFFIPVALACAELASAWPKNGGLYAWVKEAFGERAGAMAVWLEWIESVVWLPTVLSFIASSIAYALVPELTEHRYFMLAAMLATLWSGTFLNFLGTQTSSWVSTLGIIAGSIIPGFAIIALGFFWLGSGEPIHIDFNLGHLFSDFNFHSLAYFTAIALGFGGIEVAAFYVQETKDPQRTFPRATLIAAIIIISIYMLGSLAIAMVIPSNEMNLSSGMMQAMTKFFNYLAIPWAVPLFALFSVVGGLALLNTWILGPSKGLHSAAMNDDLPAFTKMTNRKGAPIVILLMQAVIGSLLISLNLLIPTINHFYWIFQTMAAQLILLMYLMIFASVIKLRYSQPQTPRLYKIPGGLKGVWAIAGTGAFFCIAAFLVGFVPPIEYQFLDSKSYALILAFGIMLFCSPPLIWQWWKKKEVTNRFKCA